MKKVQYKLAELPPIDKLESFLNEQGSVGWRLVQMMGTASGAKFLLERQTDEEVDAADVEKYEAQKKEAELMAKFSPNAGPPAGTPTLIR